MNPSDPNTSRARRAALTVAAAAIVAACGGDGSGEAVSADPGRTVAQAYAQAVALGLADEDLDAYLYERALEEGGTLVMYHDPTGADIVDEWSRTFSDRYPGLSLTYVELDTDDFVERVVAEHRAGRPQADLVRRSVAALSRPRAEGMLVEHGGLLAAAGVPAWTVTPTGLIDRVSPTVLMWRTDIPDRRPPTSWDDFLLPEHAGCVLPTSPSWVTGLVAARGEAAAEDWIRRFLANDGQVAVGSSAQVRRLVAGEIDCVVYGTAVRAEVLRADGAALDWAVPEDAPALVHQFSVLTTTPRPHAAALFIRWAGGPEGARIASAGGESVVHPDAEVPFERLRVWQDEDSPEFRRTRLIDLDEVAAAESAAVSLIERYLLPAVGG